MQIELLAGFRISVDSVELASFHQPRVQLLLAYLLLHRHNPQSRQHIAFRFWPDSTEKQARVNLRKLLYLLRKLLPRYELFLQATNSTLQWRDEALATVDVFTFEAHLDDAAAFPSSKAKSNR